MIDGNPIGPKPFRLSTFLNRCLVYFLRFLFGAVLGALGVAAVVMSYFGQYFSGPVVLRVLIAVVAATGLLSALFGDRFIRSLMRLVGIMPAGD